MENRNQKSTIIILGVLLTLAVVAGGYFWNKNAALDEENKELSADLETLYGLRTDLVDELEALNADYDSLESDYEEMASMNDSMNWLLKETTQSVEEKRAEIAKIKKGFAEDAKGVKAEIEQLRAIKKELTAAMKELEKENSRLTMENQMLVDENMELGIKVTELEQLNIGLEKKLTKLAAANSRAANFRVDVKKANDKITSSHNRAREIVVSFDLKNLPKDKLKEDRLYLVIKDVKGTPIKVKNPVSTTVNPNTGEATFPIIAQQSMRTDLQNGIRLQFKQPLDEKLKRGYYRASVYADWGLLGTAQFQLK